jgi:hypothetical protein
MAAFGFGRAREGASALALARRRADTPERSTDDI